MVIELKSDSAVAKIDTKGAELISFLDVFGQEYMWQKNPKYWGRCSPVLFPVVGNLRNNTINIKGKPYTIEKHGFCRDREFKVMYQSKDKLILNTSFDEETLKMYPFKFSLTLTYVISGGQISLSYTVLNLGEEEMLYCIGGHPAFNVPLADGGFEDYCLSFSQKEPEGCPTYDGEKLHVDVNNRFYPLDANNCLPLRYSLFDKDAVIFDKLHSNSITLSNIKTGRGVQFDIEGFDSIAFWTPTKLAAPFLCLEPWNGMAVRSDESDDFETKFSAKRLAPNQQHITTMTIIPL